MKLTQILFKNSSNYLLESKQNIVSLGFPEIIASILYQKFGKNAFLIAKWLKEDESHSVTATTDDWWRMANRSFSFSRNIDLYSLVEIYDAAKISQEKYDEVMRKHELSPDDDFNQPEILDMLKTQIEEKLNEKLFFSYDTLIKDIQDGKITDLKPYKDLSYQAAKDKYDKKRIFKNDATVIREYPNGWKWLNVGAKCQLIGGQMKNCGSAGVMSMDSDKTILTLFDKQNKPHIMTTYSPNEKRLSGAEGVGSSEPKDKYHDYIIDLAQHLGVEFDYEKSKSKLLKLKAALKNQYKNIELITKNTFNEFYKITMNDNSVYYTDSYTFVSENEIAEISDQKYGGDIMKGLGEAFNYHNNYGIKRIYLQKFLEGQR